MQIEIMPFKEGDITSEYLSWLSDRNLMKFSRQSVLAHSYESSVDYMNELRDSDGEFMKIVEAKTRITLGTLSFRRVTSSSIDLGLMVAADNFRGKGVGRIAWKMGIDFAWRNFPIDRITAGSNSKNIAMLKIIETSGMSFERKELEDGETLYFYSISRAS